MKMGLYSPVLLALVITVGVVGSNGQAPVDCLQAFFQQADVRSSHIDEYVLAFRRNGLRLGVLYGLDFAQLCKLLRGRSFNFTHAGDVDKIHQCVSDRGPCVVQPFCKNFAECKYSEATGEHRCDCTDGYDGAMCETKTTATGRLGRAEEDIRQLSTVLANVGITYTRWGNHSCNEKTGAETVSSGYMAGQYFTHIGGGSNYLCLPFTPEYSTYQGGHQHQGLVYGVEFETAGSLSPSLHDQNPTCSVCRASGRTSQVMLPATTTCPPTWTREYGGYVMSSHHAHQRTEYICVDDSPEVVDGESANTNGALLYYVEAVCNQGLQCPPYDTNKELTCVVCSR